MKKLLPRFLLLAILFFVFPAASFAQIAKIVFTTDPQTVKPNTLSGSITIQTQDSSGNVFQTIETIDLEFISTSATGEFLGGTGNPVTTYMNKNTANRTFYYKDSTEGVFTITVNAKGRETSQEWSVNQQIIVSSSAPQSTDQNPPEVLGASSSSSSSSSSSQSSGSSTVNVSSLSAQLEVLAGSDRTTSPGSPIWFQATTKKNTTLTGLELNWSFGDGNVGTGSLVSHTYKYHGDYVVVLSARAGDIFSISRLKVKVAESDVSVSNKDKYLEISNNSNTEINLFNWKLENEGKGFIFQPNTIILPHSLIKLDKSLLKMKGLDNSLGTRLKNSLGEDIFSIAPADKIDLNEISKNLDNIKKETLIIQGKIASTKIKAEKTEIISINLPQATTSAEKIIYETPPKSSILSKAWNFLIGMLH